MTIDDILETAASTLGRPLMLNVEGSPQVEASRPTHHGPAETIPSRREWPAIELSTSRQTLDEIASGRRSLIAALAFGDLTVAGPTGAAIQFLTIASHELSTSTKSSECTDSRLTVHCRPAGIDRVLTRKAGFPDLLTADRMDQMLVLACLLVELPDHAIEDELDKLLKWFAEDTNLRHRGIERLTVSLADLAVGNSDHRAHREAQRAARNLGTL